MTKNSFVVEVAIVTNNHIRITQYIYLCMTINHDYKSSVPQKLLFFQLPPSKKVKMK